MDSPTAQGTEGQPTNGQTTQAGQPHDGFQKRIDELTAEKHQANARLAQLEDTLTQQAALVADLTSKLATGIQSGQPAAERTEVDPELAKQVQAVVDPMVRRIEATLGAVAGKFGAAEQREIEAQLGDADLVKQAKRLQGLYAQSGVQAELQTCVDQIIGQKVRAERQQKTAEESRRRAGNAGYSVLQGGAAPATGAAVPGPGAAHPASKFTPEYLNSIGLPGGPTARQLDKEMAAMSALPLAGVIRGG